MSSRGLPWFQVEMELLDSKALEVSVDLDVHECHAVGMANYAIKFALQSTWSLTAAPHGRFPGKNAVPLLERAMKWTGQPGAAVAAFKRIGLFEDFMEGLRVKGMERYRSAWERYMRRKPTKAELAARELERLVMESSLSVDRSGFYPEDLDRDKRSTTPKAPSRRKARPPTAVTVTTEHPPTPSPTARGSFEKRELELPLHDVRALEGERRAPAQTLHRVAKASRPLPPEPTPLPMDGDSRPDELLAYARRYSRKEKMTPELRSDLLSALMIFSAEQIRQAIAATNVPGATQKIGSHAGKKFGSRVLTARQKLLKRIVVRLLQDASEPHAQPAVAGLPQARQEAVELEDGHPLTPAEVAWRKALERAREVNPYLAGLIAGPRVVTLAPGCLVAQVSDKFAANLVLDCKRPLLRGIREALGPGYALKLVTHSEDFSLTVNEMEADGTEVVHGQWMDFTGCEQVPVRATR